MAYDRSDDKKSELLLALKAEEQWAASYLKSELQEAQIDALRRYYGDEYGDEVEGRSRVTTREVYEVIQWLRPDLRRTFTAGDKVFEFEGVTAEADQYAQEATDLVNHTFLCDNQGERELDAFIFDGLLQRVGVMGCEWHEAEYSPAQEVSGLNSMQVQQLFHDGRTEIVEQEVRQDMPDEAHPDGLFFDLKIRQRTRDAFPEVFCIAPEDFRIAARTVDLESARYAGDIVRMMRGEAKKKWPEYADEIDAHQGDTGGFNTDERRAERFRDLEGWDAGAMRDGQAGEADEVEIMREYIRHDMDGDGIAELIRCYRLGDCLLECEEVDEHIYSHWTPNPIPHRFFGLSLADEAAPVQRTKTVLTRGFLDAINFSIVPRTYANTKMITQRGLDALLTVRPGVIIEGEGAAGEALQPLITPDVSAPALTGMQWMDRVLESRTGVNRSAQPMDPDLLHDTAKGVELLQNAASVRKEEIARNLAVGLQVLGMKLYRLIHKHQNEARSVKIAGQWRNIDPRAWEADVRCTVSVGLGTGAREKQLMMLQMIQQDQVAWVTAYGPGTPVVTPQHLHNLVAEKLRLIGFKTPDKFFGDPIDPQTGQPFVPQPPPDPNAAKAQADLQIKQMEIQATQQTEAMKVQATERQTVLQAEKDMQVATAQQRDEMVRVQMDAANNERTAALELAKVQQAAEQAAMEHEREMARMANEAALAQAELELKARELAIKERELEVRQQEAAADRAVNAALEGEKLKDAKEARKEQAKEKKPEPKENGHDRSGEAIGKGLEALAQAMSKPKTIKRGPDGKPEGIE
jgi:hypothetical protein